MRIVQPPQNYLGQTAIEDFEFDPHCRDDIPNTLRGLQYIYSTDELQQKVFALLESELLASPAEADDDADSEASQGINPTTGRPGMDLWKVLVFGVLKQSLDCDYDRLENLANNHRQLRAMLGLDDHWEEVTYESRTIARNVDLLTPSLLGKVNQISVDAGHALVGHEAGQKLQGRCDSFVVETDVHYPTDVNLLWDSLRCLIRTVAGRCKEFGLGGWRQSKHLTDKARTLFNRVRTAKQRDKKADRVGGYLEMATEIVERAEGSLEHLEKAGEEVGNLNEINGYLEHTKRQMDQVERRLVLGETIPHEEKVFSIFLDFTRWCVKGKPGIQVELGVPVSVVESEHQFVMNYKVMWEESDVDVGAELIADTQANYPDLKRCSFDKGYHSKGARKALDRLLELVAMPRKGKLSKAAKEEESEEEFVAARRAHAAVEAGIRNLEKHGLERVRSRSKDGFERTVGLSIVATNVHRIGLLLQRAERERLRKLRLRRAA